MGDIRRRVRRDGIHPTADDIPGRLIGAVIGPKAFHHAERYFSGELGVPPPITAQLTLVKHVTTDDSGTASASDWLLSAAGPTPISGQGGVDSGVAAGTYALSESGGPAGYSASAWVCLGGSQNGNQITLTEGEAATCTITNDDNSLAHLRLVKQVTTDDGGAASPGDWQLSAAGPTPISGQGGIDSDVAAGTYVLSEFGGPPGYTASAWVCVGGNQSGNQITLTEGESATCTVTNDDDPVISTHFVDVTESALVSHTHATTQTIFFPSELPSATMDEVAIMGTKAEVTSSWITGGVAAGDYDGDGLPDMFVAGGDAGTSRLFQNRGDGTFENKAAVAGVEITGERTAGAVFADYDGDGDLDLFVGGAVGTSPRLFRNNGPNTEGEITFVDVFATAFPSFDLIRAPNTWGGAFGDYDLDGDLDLFLPHDMTPFGPSVDSSVHGSTQHLWRNNGDETFTDVSVDSGISALFAGDVRDETFTPNFADVDEDGYPDLLIVADRAASLVLINQRDGTFEDETDHSAFLSPVNGRGKVAGMGGSVGDYDRDGSLDWFVSQIRRRRDSHRLFRSEGNATFTDVSLPSGVDAGGHWGWGTCFADLNNDQHLDLVLVNGFYWNANAFSADGLFTNTPAAAFVANGDSTFTERAAELGLGDTGEGRGLSCFDYDRDGDIDVAISNHRGPFKLYQNTLDSSAAGFVSVQLAGPSPNTQGIGARLELSTENPGDADPGLLIRELRAGDNFLSADLAEAHFGLGDWQGPFTLVVDWLGGQTTSRSGVGRNAFVTVEQTALSLLNSNLSFALGEPAVLQATATEIAGHDRSTEIQWSLDSLENIVGSGSTFDASGWGPETYQMFISVTDGAETVHVLPFTLTIAVE